MKQAPVIVDFEATYTKNLPYDSNLEKSEKFWA